MEIIKCNKCKKIKKGSEKDKWFHGGFYGFGEHFHSFDLCEKRGKPLMKYLKRYLKLKNKIRR